MSLHPRVHSTERITFYYFDLQLFYFTVRDQMLHRYKAVDIYEIFQKNLCNNKIKLLTEIRAYARARVYLWGFLRKINV